jgi:hypothetical protein
MRNLVKYATDRDFTEPLMPDSKLRSEDHLHEVCYKEVLSNFNQEKQIYETQKTNVFGIILGQYSPMVKDRLNNDAGFKAIELAAR